MSADPILILQMQRMGDLVLTFPLLGWLGQAYPEHPLWVVGEKMFFEPLMPLSPKVSYFSYEAAPQLKSRRYRMVINVSHRQEAAALAGAVSSGELFGPYLTDKGNLFIRGDWQLYRASLTHNNRYNRYHWADLNALDCIPPSFFRHTRWPLPRNDTARQNARLGLFLGASEPEKHPEAPFWAELARKLIQREQKPVLLGGAKEKKLGSMTAGILKAPALNLTDHFTVSSLAKFIAKLDLLVTPDTGPMHIAAWTGTPTINLSMGPVSAWETGPFSPGHHVIRSKILCEGCWQCRQREVFCKKDFSAPGVAALAEQILRRENGEKLAPLLRRSAKNLELLVTARDEYGLYDLKSLPGHEESASNAPNPWLVRDLTGQFWKNWFGSIFSIFPETKAGEAWREIAETSPRLAARFREELARITRGLSKNALSKGAFADDSFWSGFPAMLRPLSGYIQMYVRNESLSRQSILKALELVERLGATTA